MGISWKPVALVILVLFIIGKCVGGDEEKRTDKSTTKTEQFIGNNSSNNKQKRKKKSKKKSKKRRNRQGISFVTVDEPSCSWAIIIPCSQMDKSMNGQSQLKATDDKINKHFKLS